MYGSKLDVI